MKTQANGRTAALLLVLHLGLAFAPHRHAAAQRPQQQQPPARGLSGDLAKNRAAQQDQAALAELPAKQKRWALVIGVDQYRDRQIGRLNGAANDARTLSDALVRYAGFPADQVILLATDQPEERQPTRVNVLRRLSNLASVVPADGLLLVSFAGHGMERGGQAYLLPSDAQMSEDVTFLEDTAVSVSRLKDRIRATGVKQVIVLLDACRNDPGGRADAPNPMTPAFAKFDFDVRNREVQAFATLYATAVGQRAYEYSEKKQGYFTWALVEGLKGGAANERGEVSLAQLVSYVQSVVPKRLGIDLGTGKQQRPFAVIEGYRAEQLVVAVAPAAAAAAAAPSSSSPAPAAVDPAAMELTFWEAIKNSTDPADFSAYLERFPDGTFSDLARRRARPAAGASSPPAPSVSEPGGGRPVNVSSLLAQAELDFGDRRYDAVVEAGREVLSAEPNNARASLLVGQSFLRQKRYANASAHLAKAVALGERVDIPVKHHHYAFLSGDALCDGYLSFGKGLFEFHSTSVAGHDFGVPVSKVYELVAEQVGGGRLRAKVGVQKEKKEDRKTYNFHTTDAYVSKQGGSTVNSVFCDACLPDLNAAFQLIQQLLQAPAVPQDGRSAAAPSAAAPPPGGAAAAAGAEGAEAHEQLRQELLALERRAFEAAIKGDRATIASMMADEFKQTQDGKTFDKAQVLAAIKPQPLLHSFSYESVSLSFEGEVAVLSGVGGIRARNANAMVTIRQQFTDRFVKRDGRWLILSSESKSLK